MLKIAQIILQLWFQKISFYVFCCNCGVQRTPYDTNDSPRIKIVIYPYISHCLSWLWLCFSFFLVVNSVIYFWDEADLTNFSCWHFHFCCCPFMRTFKAVTETQSGMQHLNFTGLAEHLPLSAMERSSSSRKCNQNSSDLLRWCWMLCTLLRMQTAETKTLFVVLVVAVVLL